jgi:hypothetical protein
MSTVYTRIFAYLTLCAYLVVGVAVVRFAMPETVTLSFDRSYLNTFAKYKVAPAEVEPLVQSEIKFAEIVFPVGKIKKVVAVKRAHPVHHKVISKISYEPYVVEVKVSSNELPFKEPIQLRTVVFEGELLSDTVALFENVKEEKISEMVAEIGPSTVEVKDEIKTSQAQTVKTAKTHGKEEALDGMFFEYPVEDKKTEVAEAAPQVIEKNLQTMKEEEVAAAAVPTKTEEVNLGDMIGFDYSRAQQGIQQGTIPTVSAVPTQHENDSHHAVLPVAAAPVQQEEANPLISKPAKSLTKKMTTHASRVEIQLTSTDLKKPANESNFEIRFQDDTSASLEDYGTGTVAIEEKLARARMTRSITILKRGFAPTNNDLILEGGVSTLSIPVIEENTFNELMGKYESRGFVGAILTELDDETEDVSIDMPYGEVITLDGDMKKTANSDYRYKLFIGVRAGNVLLSYKTNSREVVSRIVHVHEHEVTFDANLYERAHATKVALKEEELLSREQAPLITASGAVKIFASDKTAKKINDHTYQLDFGTTALGSRNYLELNHQKEPVFIGVKDNLTVSVPSENFMRHVLSNIDGQNLKNHCVVQVNLSRKLDKVFVGSESVNASLAVFPQMLDANGKFYESASEKTRKVIVVGESQASHDVSQDGRINFKLQYVDGSIEYLGSYCSPNTYLVEQL